MKNKWSERATKVVWLIFNIVLLIGAEWLDEIFVMGSFDIFLIPSVMTGAGITSLFWGGGEIISKFAEKKVLKKETKKICILSAVLTVIFLSAGIIIEFAETENSITIPHFFGEEFRSYIMNVSIFSVIPYIVATFVISFLNLAEYCELMEEKSNK